MDSMRHPEQVNVRNGRHLNKFFKALSDETRRHILQLLNDGDRTVGEIVGNFHLSQPTISRHLSVLKEANLVVDQRQGQHVIYRLSLRALSRSAEEFFSEFRHSHPTPEVRTASRSVSPTP